MPEIVFVLTNEAIYGMSTGPKTTEGWQAIAQATRQRMASGQRERALEGFYFWLSNGGRELLSRHAKNREKRRRWKRLVLEQTHASPKYS